MGWLYMNRHHMGGHATAKSYLDAQFTFDWEAGEDGIAHSARVLASSCPGNRVYYAAVQYRANGEITEVLGIVCLVRWNPKDKDNLHFGYKDLSEKMGPCEDGCPSHILDLLTPTDNEYALDWRRRCRANLQRRSRKIEDGMRIRLAEPVTFTDGYEDSEFIVVKRGRSITFRVPDGHGRYRITGFRERDWSVAVQTRVHRTVFASPSTTGAASAKAIP
ncbi:MAG: hypothetical protein QHC67_14675 [Sphingobium sp.]|uniref:DUF6927 domain-containing protein n=1 Tax=Sphingobium sp. TaxID=1912891 RepID=UPI0029AB14F7|nr:hypothetical protein [Sphingobium sp.]MDX3911046.1 hypothetical protein [Sphingobium sp.]